jgi:hypothetical protein
VDRIRLDLNGPQFQADWFALERAEAQRVLASFEKISRMTWPQLYSDRGLRWEAILSRTGPSGERLYSFRITQKIRAVAFREGEFLRMVSIHSDHDSAYQKS